MSTGIKRWLVAVGRTFGCDQAHHVRWPDAKTRPEVPYFTYRVTNAAEDGPAVRGTKTSGITGEDPYTCDEQTWKQYRITVRIDLYRSEFGLGWLLKAAAAAEKEQAIKNIFHTSNIGWGRFISATDMTPDDDDERLDYHQRMIVELRTTIVHTQRNYNAKVETVDHTVTLE